MEENFMDFERIKPDALSEESAITSSTYSINRAPLRRKHAQLVEQEVESSYQDARSIFKNVKGFNQMKGAIHQIAFADPFVPADFKLLELDKGLIDEIIQEKNKKLTFRGQLSDMCVLCTEEKTYQIKEVEASNSLLLFPKLDVDTCNEQLPVNQLIQSTAVSVASTYLEVTEAPPVFSSRLRCLIKSNVLDLYEASQRQDNVGNNLTFDSLLDEIQMSEKQLREEINKYPTVEHNGFLYVLSEDTQSRILDEVIELYDNPCISSEFGTQNITFDLLKKKLSKRVTNDSINWFLRSFCDISDNDIYLLNEERVCKARAIEILHNNKSKEWAVIDFEKSIDPLIPNGFKFKLEYLKGIAFLAENIVSGKTIRCLNAEDLSGDVHKRLEHLFSLQPTWKKEDILPYIIDFCSHPSKAEEFLLKHCRLLGKGQNQERLFSLKKV